MGFELRENFKRPYFSKSIREFWQRWHITLSTWFRDYVYIPLGGNRTIKWRWYYNIFITFLVSGLGLIGLLTCQILIANGCKVLGFDPDDTKCKIAEKFGVITNHIDDENFQYWIKDNTNNIGIDGALITASTKSSSPIKQSANSCRKRGRIVMIGATGMHVNRNDFYLLER